MPISFINRNNSGNISLINRSNSGRFSMSTSNTEIVTSGLVLNLDASNPASYPGTGTTWFDLSGGSRNFTIYNSVFWNSGGYFSFDAVDDYMEGPASNTFNLDQEHTIEVIIMPTSAKACTLFHWTDAGGIRTISGHTPWNDGVVYYDVAGCCSSTQRVSYSSNILNKVTIMTFRCRTSQFPTRQVFENTIEKVNSGVNTTSTLSFGSLPVTIGSFYGDRGTSYPGRLYSIRVYNRGLTDAEILQNYNVDRAKFGL
jgi:hypothetical protein